MAKSNKFSSKVPSLAEYKFPFLNEDGEIEDVESAKKAFHTLMVDKAKAQDAREDAQAEVATVTAERDELQKVVDDKASPDAKAELEKAQTATKKAQDEAAKATARADRLEVAMEKGLTPAQAKRLVGDTKEELEADADEILELFGSAKSEDGDEDEDDEGRVSPKAKVSLTNVSDPKNKADAEPDYEKIAAEIGPQRVF